MANSSLRKRYFYKLITNLFGFGINLIAQLIIPRGLGLKYYGDFNFLTNFFNQLFSFFDTGSSMGFYTKVSKRPREFKLVSFYFYFVVIVAFLAVIFVLFMHLTGIYVKLCPGQALSDIYLALFLCFLSWITKIMNQISDAYGLTVSAEVSKILQKLIGLLIIIALFVYQKFNLINYFLYNYFILFLLVLFFYRIICRYGYSIKQSWRLTFNEIKNYSKEFYTYCHPLFAYSLVGMIIGIFDRWLLQVFGGSIQQGLFGLSFQIATVCFLFTSAMTPLIMRDFSIAYNNKDLSMIREIFRKYIRLFYSITSFLACFIAINAAKVTVIMGGSKFKGATLAVAIMAFYPIHQTYGQLSGGSVFYATAQTKLYRNIGIFFMLIGLPVTYFLIAPKNLFGLNTGANGLAIKMVLLQFFAVNVQLYFNAKFLNLPFAKYLGHQILNPIIFLGIASFGAFVASQISSPPQNLILNIVISGILYTLLASGFIYFFPVVFGLEKKNLRALSVK